MSHSIDTTHYVLASLPLDMILYCVVAEVAWVSDDPVFGRPKEDGWAARLIEVRYRHEGSEVWTILPGWAEPKPTVSRAIEDHICAAMDKQAYVPYSADDQRMHRALGITFPVPLDFIIL